MPSESAEDQKFRKETAIREKIRAAAKKEGEGEGEMALYLVGKNGTYHQGKVYKQGELIRRPVGVLPSATWTPVLDEKKGKPEAVVGKKAADPAHPADKTRAADA